MVVMAVAKLYHPQPIVFLLGHLGNKPLNSGQASWADALVSVIGL